MRVSVKMPYFDYFAILFKNEVLNANELANELVTDVLTCLTYFDITNLTINRVFILYRKIRFKVIERPFRRKE